MSTTKSQLKKSRSKPRLKKKKVSKSTPKQQRESALEGRQNKPTETERLTCPKCGTSAWVPLFTLWIAHSFLGNRLQVEWPDKRIGADDTCTVVCVQCAEIVRVELGGKVLPLNKKAFQVEAEE